VSNRRFCLILTIMRPGLKFEDIQLFTRSKMFLSLYICTLLVCISHLIEQKAVSAVSALSSNKTRLKKVAALLAQKVLDYLIPRAWIVLRKDLSMANDGELPAAYRMMVKPRSPLILFCCSFL